MKLSNYIAEFIAQQGVRHVFLVSGGAAVHMVDSVYRHPKLTHICSQHEQHEGAEADGYSRASGNLGVAMTTSGPGATNLTTSIANCYYDSIPTLFLCGQVATFRIKKSKKLRQKGFQETDIVSLFQSITNYVKQVRDPSKIKYELQKALYMAKAGRGGPVVLDIPDDLQRVEVDPKNLPEFHPPGEKKADNVIPKIKQIFSLLSKAKRPVLILGAGVQLAKVRKQALEFARYFKIPVLLTWGGMDILPFTDPLNMGGLGSCGPRAGNFAVQTSDLVIAIGTRLSQLITGGRQDLFAPKAKKVMIDVDSEELKKFTPDIFTLDIGISCKISDFFHLCQKYYLPKKEDRFKKWRKTIKSWRRRYPICPNQYYKKLTPVNPYVLIKELSKALKEKEIIFADTGANLAWTMQAFEVKEGQRIFSAWNHTPMGYSLPGAIGASFATGRRVICLIGDGGLMMCLQELATVKRHNLPIKIFIFNNHGHGIQKQTLDTWLESRYVAVDEETGLSFPDFEKIGEAFGVPTLTLGNHRELSAGIKEVLKAKGPILCNLEIIPDQKIIPMLKFGHSLENLGPTLPEDELRKVMKRR